MKGGVMMSANEELMLGASNQDDGYEEEWIVIMNTRGKYTLGKNQAKILQQAIATGSRGIIMFKTFSISIPYIAEFYRTRRYLKNAQQLPSKATEEEYKPMDPEVFKKWKKTVYEKIGKPMKKTSS